jgi:sec-independent protein translocase protein TatA
MISDLFDSPWKLLIIAAVVMVLFGAKKMPDAARSLGKSMRILKTEMSAMHDEEPGSPAQSGSMPVPPAQITSTSSMPAAPVSDVQHQNQPS